MNQPNPAPITPAVDPTPSKRSIRNPFPKNDSTDSTEKVNTKDIKSKVKTGLAAVGVIALGLTSYAVLAKKKDGTDKVEVTLPDISTTSTDA